MSNTVAQIRTRMPRIAESAVERARLTVVPRRRTRAARMPFIALVSMVLLSGVVGLLLFNTSMQQASFAATALEDQANTLAARQQSLQMDLDRLRNPQRIAKAAIGLGMVQAGNPAFLELGTGKVRGIPSAGDGSTPLRINPLPPKKPAILAPAPHVVTVLPDESAQTTGDTGRQNDGNGRHRGQNHH
ncbi:MAG TPA: hypothetical protein VFT70_03235 [Nocardioides sp.]|nr:hypothetical protein [Nocardioides sp.]